MIAVFLIFGLLVFSFLIWWLFIETEGAYLGRRVVVALYDIYAARYDNVKQFDERADIVLLSQPLLQRLLPQCDPLILDVATGTGRLPLAMARNAHFQGHVIGSDLSRRMLDIAARKVAKERFAAYVTLAHLDAMRLPFPDASFDAVTCLEALEFLPDSKAALREMTRVLRPGGILLTTLRIDTRWMPGRAWGEDEMREILESMHLTQVEIEAWQSDYSKVWAGKAGGKYPIGQSGLGNALSSLSEITIKVDDRIC